MEILFLGSHSRILRLVRRIFSGCAEAYHTSRVDSMKRGKPITGIGMEATIYLELT